MAHETIYVRQLERTVTLSIPLCFPCGVFVGGRIDETNLNLTQERLSLEPN